MKLRQIVIAQINTILDRRALKEIFPTLLFFGCRCKQVIFKFLFYFYYSDSLGKRSKTMDGNTHYKGIYLHFFYD